MNKSEGRHAISYRFLGFPAYLVQAQQELGFHGQNMLPWQPISLGAVAILCSQASERGPEEMAAILEKVQELRDAIAIQKRGIELMIEELQQALESTRAQVIEVGASSQRSRGARSKSEPHAKL